MSPTSKKKRKKELINLEQRHFLLSITRFVFSNNYIRFRVWLIVIPLLILIIKGDLLTINGLIIVLIIFGYILLSYLHKWLEKQENSR